MILKRIEADNILRYRKLRLDDLPAHGQIAVAGPNEAGKTAIGETICFGLFGRTFSLGPDELDKVIRWGEYDGSVTVAFSGRDGGDYSVVRKIDNTGGHDARLYISDEQDPVAEGIEAVEDAVRELGGFTYQSFIDSFYLAQREMEVPHGKSATIKALIGVDKLESAAAELQSEADEVAAEVRALEAETKVHRQKIAEIGFDRAHLGRLESKRAAKVEAAAAAEAESAELSARAELIGKAASSLREAARMFVESTLQTSYGQWRERREWMATSLAAAATASKYSTVGVSSPAFESTAVLIRSFEAGLAEYDKVHNLAHLYRRRLASLLDDNLMPEAHLEDNRQVAGAGETRFADRRAAVLKRIAGVTHRSRSLLVLGAFFLVGAILAWAGCALTRIAPESAAAGWLERAVSSSEAGGRSALLLAAIAGTALTAPFFLLYLRAADRLKECHRRLEDIDTEAQIAHVEMDVIDRMEEAPLPDALDALSDVRNDLLNSAVVSFADSDGAVFVRPDALAAKLAEIRNNGDRAVRSLGQAQQRVNKRTADLNEQTGALREEVTRLEEEITGERERWEQVEALERSIAGLEAKAGRLRDEIGVRELGRELIDGACRRIYSRFHPELRRIVSKVLPRLTEDRYEHLEIDDDLRIRVFCKEKNDFVGLAEISNGAHRQLMLCVRLALSQALIASSSKAAQFIFFDEPFAFFDAQRMAKAINMLRKISPQITQVWLATQEFDDPSAFDVVLNCDVNNDCLEASGNGRPLQTAPALNGPPLGAAGPSGRSTGW